MCSNYLPKAGVVSLSFKMLYIKAGHFIQRYLLYFKWDLFREVLSLNKSLNSIIQWTSVISHGTHCQFMLNFQAIHSCKSLLYGLFNIVGCFHNYKTSLAVCPYGLLPRVTYATFHIISETVFVQGWGHHNLWDPMAKGLCPVALLLCLLYRWGTDQDFRNIPHNCLKSFPYQHLTHSLCAISSVGSSP